MFKARKLPNAFLSDLLLQLITIPLNLQSPIQGAVAKNAHVAQVENIFVCCIFLSVFCPLL